MNSILFSSNVAFFNFQFFHQPTCAMLFSTAKNILYSSCNVVIIIKYLLQAIENIYRKMFFHHCTLGMIFYLLFLLFALYNNMTDPTVHHSLWSNSDQINVITIKMIALRQAIGEKKPYITVLNVWYVYFI